MEKASEVLQLEADNIYTTPLEADRSMSIDSVRREAVGGESAADLGAHYYRSWQYIGSFLSFGLSYLSAIMGYVMPANALSIINADIGPSESEIWVLLVFILCQTITFLVVGRLSDIFGRRWFFIGGNSVALVGWLVCSRANSIDMLIGGSVIAGFGTGVQQSIPVITGELIQNKHRFASTAITIGAFAPLAAISPGLTRVFADTASDGWRLIYYVVAAISGLAATLQFVFYHPPTFDQLHTKSSKIAALKGLDYAGLFLFIGSTSSLLFGISWGGQKYPWKSYQVITTILVGAFGLTAFMIYENYTRVAYPLVPLHLFRNRNFVAITTVSAVGLMVFNSISVVWPEQITILFGASTEATGWISSTVVAGAMAGEVLASVGSFLPHPKWQLVLACVMFTIFLGAMAAITHNKETMAILFSIISSTMIGFMEIFTLAGGTLTTDSKDIGAAVGVLYSLRSTMGALALSMYITIFENKASSNLVSYVAPAAVEAGLPESSLTDLFTAIAAGTAAALEAVPGITTDILEAVGAAEIIAYTKAFQIVYLISITFGVCAVIAALMIDGSKLEANMTTDVARKLQGITGKEELNEQKIV